MTMKVYVVVGNDGRCVCVQVSDGFDDPKDIALKAARQSGISNPFEVYADVSLMRIDAQLFSKNPEEHGDLLAAVLDVNRIPKVRFP